MANVNIRREFLTAGDAVFTVKNHASGNHYTYRIAPPKTQKDPNNPIYFVSALVGPDNTSDYAYMGLLIVQKDWENWKVVKTAKSSWGPETTIFKALVWAIKVVVEQQTIPDVYSIKHSGHCGRCGRLLTEPESIDCGIGPICRTLL